MEGAEAAVQVKGRMHSDRGRGRFPNRMASSLLVWGVMVRVGPGRDAGGGHSPPPRGCCSA